MPPQRALTEARQIASAHGCMVTEHGGKDLVYRKTALRPVYLGARGTPEALRTFVRRVTTTQGKPAPVLPANQE